MRDVPPVLAGIKASMQHMSQRQQVLAQNIANSETPGYRGRELEAPDFSSLVQGAGGTPRVAAPRVMLTDAMQGLGAVQPAGANGVIFDTDIAETKPDGNNVTLEDQLLRMGELQADFTAMAGLYRKQMDLMRKALGRSG
ncbi:MULTISPECIES: flagellar basal body protein [unclassified Sphingosinithalassobacter]|uniref:flagellar basal body protein n=1 Tax=unclassified Sphingosinithalassobacter TaxID=2676235 RepID=UPI00165EBB73|nr:flagellar basal body protein [Sphingosinithalassobacter sp. CS137]